VQKLIQSRAVRNTPAEDFKVVWKSGPPPSVGWWPASREMLQKDTLRFWNGSQWSLYVRPNTGAKAAGWLGEIIDPVQDSMCWCQRWWELV
jgi:hypothetical protein